MVSASSFIPGAVGEASDEKGAGDLVGAIAFEAHNGGSKSRERGERRSDKRLPKGGVYEE
jgi:hypothetical protein